MYSNEVSKQEKKSLWRFGTKEVVYPAIGAALYAVVTWAFNICDLFFVESLLAYNSLLSSDINSKA